MKIFNQDSLIEGNRFFIASIFIWLGIGLLLFRLWYLQIYKGEYYAQVSERNRIRKFEIPAPRGLIYDRFGKTILTNRPFYDLVYIPQYVKNREVTLNILSRLLHIQVSVFESRLRMSSAQPKYMPVTLKRNLSLHEVSTVESNRIFLPGIEIQVAPRRDYHAQVPSHVVGYLGEIDENTLKKLKAADPKNTYLPGDLIGKHGLESKWEKFLRGKNGYRLIQVDAFGRKAGIRDDENWQLPTVPAQKGGDLELTLDFDLQLAATEAFKGKYGAVIVMNPQTGEILSMVSEPGYDPTIYQKSLSREEWYSIINNPFKPLFDKTTGGEYIPGSIYKSVVAIAALEEGIVDANKTYVCPGYFTLGDQVFQCWEHKGHGIVNLKKAIVKSCDVFFYHLGVELGADKIAEYARKLGLGKELGVNLNLERPGLIPTSAWKKLTQRIPWTPGDTPNIAIGQGYNLLTPIQMLSLYSVIANSGKIYKPFLVHKVTNYLSDILYERQPELIRDVEGIKPETFAAMRSMLQEVVMSPEGTGRNAAVKGTTVAGKTGSAQVVSMKKNDNKLDDVSVKWKEHAIFAAFSPAESAEIALIIVSENDAIGGGGAQAAPVAKKIIQAYWDLKTKRNLPAASISVGSKPGNENEHRE